MSPAPSTIHKVLLVQPNYAQGRSYTKYSVTPPLGLCYIAGLLEEKGVGVEILDANALNLSIDDVLRHAAETKPAVVGISVLMGGYKYATEIAKKLPKDILSVAGGAYASALPEKILQDGFKIAVKGRGEYIMLEIASGKELKDIAGIFYRLGGTISANPPRPFENLKSAPLPKPARHLLVNNGVNKPYRLAGTLYFPWAPVFTSIGCPYQCYWCSKQVFDRFMPREPEDVVSEIKELVEKYEVKEIDVYDDCFNANLERAEKILDLIIKENLNVKLRFPNGIRANMVNRAFMEKMKKAGCIEVAYGIESGNQDVLNKIPKVIFLEEIRKAVEYTRKAKILTVGFFILGLRGDNEKTMQETINFAKELAVDVAFFSILTPYPGTPLWSLIEKEGKFLIKDYDDLHQSRGKMSFLHPDFPPPALTEKMQKRAYRSFYFSPQYLLKRLIRLKNWEQLALNIRGLPEIIKTQFK